MGQYRVSQAEQSTEYLPLEPIDQDVIDQRSGKGELIR